MKTDQLIYQFLATGAEAFRVLTRITLPGPYQFSAPVLKGLERRIDALFEPQDHAGPVYVVEFQAQMQPSAWYNLLAKVGLYGEKHSLQQVCGILIFPYKALDNQDITWIRSGTTGLLAVVYLDEFLPELLITDPHNPFVAVFAPLFVKNDADLIQQAPSLWNTIHTAPVSKSINATLEQILEFWFIERFRNLDDQEVLAMFQITTPLEETKSYQCIMAKGEARGEVRGEARALLRLLEKRFHTVPATTRYKIDAADLATLELWFDRAIDASTLDQVFMK